MTNNNGQWHYYYQYKVSIDIEGAVYPGYACESSEADDSPSNLYPDGVYPYKYAECGQEDEDGSRCKPGQLFLPR